VLVSYPLVEVVVWGSPEVGFLLILVAFTFFYTPLRFVLLASVGIFIVSSYATIRCADYLGLLFPCRYTASMDSKFQCLKEGEQSSQDYMFVIEPIGAVTTTIVFGIVISYTREKYLRSNFLLLSISECQKRIMHLRQDQNTQMLASMLPSQMIERLKSKESSVVVDSYSEVTVLFAIIDNFAAISSEIPAVELVSLLNLVYSCFDQITDEMGVHKVETVGEVFMVCAGCPQPCTDHADRAAQCALAMQDAMTLLREELQDMLPEGGSKHCVKNLQIKVGIHTGPIVAGLLNTEATIRFKLFGDTVNTASRMQSNAGSGQIQVSEKTFQKIVFGNNRREFIFSEPRTIHPKGKGKMVVRFLERYSSPKERQKGNHPNLNQIEADLLKSSVDEDDGTSGGGASADMISGLIRAKLGSKTAQGVGENRARLSTSSGRAEGEVSLTSARMPSLKSSRSVNFSDSRRDNDITSELGTTGGGRGAVPRKNSVLNILDNPDSFITEDDYFVGDSAGMVEEMKILRTSRLRHTYALLMDRPGSDMTPVQCLYTIFGTEVEDFGKDDMSSKYETEYSSAKLPLIIFKTRAIFVAYFFLCSVWFVWTLLKKIDRGQEKFQWLSNVFCEETLLVCDDTEPLTRHYCCGENLNSSTWNATSWEKVEHYDYDIWTLSSRSMSQQFHTWISIIMLGICGTMLFNTYRKSYLKSLQTLNMFLWFVFGMCWIAEIGVFVPKVGYTSISIYILVTLNMESYHWFSRLTLGVMTSLVYYIMLNVFATSFGKMQMTFEKEGEGEQPPRLFCRNRIADWAIALPYECNMDLDNNFLDEPDGFATGILFGSNDTVCKDMLTSLTSYVMESISLEPTDSITKNRFVESERRGDFQVMEYSFRKQIQELGVGDDFEYWKVITSFDSAYYFGILFFFSMLLVYPFLEEGYNLRVCFNRLKVQERNNKIMQKQFNLSELLLGRLLPPDIVKKMRDTQQQNSELAENYSNVTILFCDMVGFTKFSSELDPSELMSFLSELYARYSKVLNKRNLYTVEVIGDALLAVAGCPEKYRDANHAARALTAAVELIDVTKALSFELQIPINIRVGVHSGPVIAGVVGKKDPRYHLFGRTVKMAEVFESTGTAGRVHCSINTYQEITSSFESQCVEFRKTVEFIKREDLDDDQKRSFEKIGYVGDTFYCAPKNKDQVGNLNYRRLTLGREGILGGMKSPMLSAGSMKGISESGTSPHGSKESFQPIDDENCGKVEEKGDDSELESGEDDYDSHA